MKIVFSQEDVILWPDGTWCYREDLPQMQWKSDDYRTVTPEDVDFPKELLD